MPVDQEEDAEANSELGSSIENESRNDEVNRARTRSDGDGEKSNRDEIKSPEEDRH